VPDTTARPRGGAGDARACADPRQLDLEADALGVVPDNLPVPVAALDGEDGARPDAGGTRLPELAVEIGVAHLAANDAAQEALERAAECGRLLLEAKALVGHGNWLPWLEQNTTVGPRQSQKYMRLAQHWDELEVKSELTSSHLTLSDAVKLLAEPRDDDASPGGGIVSMLRGFSGNNQWYTPYRFVEAAREVMGGIDLDPATCALAQETVRAERFFTEADDGLAQSWGGRVWMNPPYSTGLIDKFTGKLIQEYQAGNVSQAVVLVDNRTDTRWFHGLAGACSRVCFTLGRINFYNENANSSGPANGSAVLYFGPRVETFDRVFARFGSGGAFTFTAGGLP
jgi:phage N-6-adenine-methyltransferase